MVGVALGSMADTRVGAFDGVSPNATGDVGVGPVTQSGFFPWVFIEPELRVGVHVTEHLGLGVTLSALILVPPRVPRWREAMLINPHGQVAGAGVSTPGKFAAESLTGSAILAITEGLSVRYDF